MNNRKENLTFNTVATITGISLCYLLAKYHRNIIKQIQLIFDYKNPLRYQNTKIISNLNDCKQVAQNLKRDCDEYNVLGFDCEWITVGGCRRPIAMLQLSSHRGLCALFRLCHLKRIPSELKLLLEDDNIIKVGVAPFGDSKYLAKDYGVCVASTLDLRFLAIQTNCNASGLSKLSEENLNIILNKDWRIRCSDWEAKILNQQQIDYAAKDAHVAIELFKVFANKLQRKSMWTSNKNYLEEIINEYCYPYLDVNFNATPNNISVGKKANKINAITAFSNKFQSRNIATRKKPLYYNCFLEAPDGELLCTCAKKKALWYVEKELGQLLNEDPFTVRLNFEPAGRAVGDTGKYYQTPKSNQCVVCGETEKYIRKNIVPREYRKYFPFSMKDHTSHDVLLLCPRCHQLSNASDQKIREKLAIECDAPFSTKDGGAKTVDVPRLRELKSISRALLYQKDKLPIIRLEQLETKFIELNPDYDEITDDLLQFYSDIDTTELNENYFAHGAKVVEYYKNTTGGLTALERLWREHFLRVIRPKHMPELWSVEHNVERLEIRAEEGRIDKNDLKLAGINR